MMKPSEFQTTIENQFDYICKVAMEDERKDYLKALSRQCKRETLFFTGFFYGKPKRPEIIFIFFFTHNTPPLYILLFLL